MTMTDEQAAAFSRWARDVDDWEMLRTWLWNLRGRPVTAETVLAHMDSVDRDRIESGHRAAP